MNCPACDNKLEEIHIGDISVDICKGGCGGLWFDNFELRKFDEPHESEGESLIDVERDENLNVDHSRRRVCPRCGDTVLMRHFFTVKHEVEVDECPGCGGCWLDSGELGFIRIQYDTEEERKAAAEKYLSDILDVELEPLRRESREKLEKAERIAHIFRFLCPSYWIPGKQKWGAF